MQINEFWFTDYPSLPNAQMCKNAKKTWADVARPTQNGVRRWCPTQPIQRAHAQMCNNANKPAHMLPDPPKTACACAIVPRFTLWFPDSHYGPRLAISRKFVVKSPTRKIHAFNTASRKRSMGGKNIPLFATFLSFQNIFFCRISWYKNLKTCHTKS